MNRKALITAVLLVPLLLSAQQPEEFDHTHSLFDVVLRTYVSDGLVDYKILKNDQGALSRYLASLAKIDPNAYEGWTREQKLALWINAYNAYTIKAILDHYPIKPSFLADPLGHYPPNSVRQIRGVWDKLTWPVMGKAYTLDHMEHVIMRKELAEPRVHFVLVCASIGCPLLENRAFDAARLNQRLDQAIIDYIYRDRKIDIDKENKIVRLARIFEWFADDFLPNESSPAIFRVDVKTAGVVKHSDLTGSESQRVPVRTFVEAAGPLSWVYQYVNAEDRDFLAGGNYKVTYFYYDWGLNEKK